jgi:type IV pilus assembly protein PilY1
MTKTISPLTPASSGLRPHKLWWSLLLCLSPLTLQAQFTDLSDVPLANMSATTVVRPNILFLMDDSGSMGWQFTPDYVNDATSTSLLPRYTGYLGDPPYMSSHYNKQYYNPRVQYKPPVGWDGSSTQGSLTFPSQNRANTTNWTRVRTDGFNKENFDQFHYYVNWVDLYQPTSWTDVTHVNLATGYPDRVYCTAAGDDVNNTSLCKNNDPGFLYAHGHTNVATGAYSVGMNGGPKYKFGAPYYYNLQTWEYCQDAALTNCVTVTPGSAAPAGYPYASNLRWCTSTTNANKAVTTAAECRGKRGPGFQVPRFTPQANSTASYGSITLDADWCATRPSGISTNQCNASAVMTNIKVNGVSIINTASPPSVTTTTTTNRQAALANAIATAINNQTSTPEYFACAGTACNSAPFNQFGLGAVAANQVMVVAFKTPGNTTPPAATDVVTDNSRAGFVIEATPAPAQGQRSAWVRMKVTNAGAGNGNITSIRVGPDGGPYTEILNGPLTTFLNNTNSASRNRAGQAICNRINALTATTGYTAHTGGSINYTSTSCGEDDDFFIKTPLSLGGTPNNTYKVLVTTTGTNTTIAANTNPLFVDGYTSPVVTVSTQAVVAGSSPISAFARVNITPSRTTYPRDAARLDCVTTAGVCTYDEEMTNFANWYAYYRTRNQMMKSSAGHAFLPIGENYRLGYNTINNNSFNNTSRTNWVAVNDLTSTQKNTWYNTLYANDPVSSTPLRVALSKAGEYFKGNLSGANSPIQYSCQRNYTILTTDGYWNGGTASGVGDADNVNNAAEFCTRANGCYDGGIASSVQSLSDVAAHYYRNDLRTDMVNNVPVSSEDPNPAQHMTTFTLGLGVDGLLSYRPDYDTATTGDFYRIRTGDSNCEWAAGATCNWPIPVNDSDTAVDDLWHAAVSGHGKYFSAKDPNSLAEGLSQTLNALQIRTGAAAASSTSTPNVTQEDNLEFSSTFRTVKWDGELVAQYINVTDGSTNAAVIWSARTRLQMKAGSGSVDTAGTFSGSADSRQIFTTSASATPSKRDFEWGELTSTEQAWFSNKCTGAGLLSQCSSLTTDQKTLANNGEFMLNYLRGQQALENFEVSSGTTLDIFRKRDYILADIAGSKPAYVPKPRRKFSDTGYAGFVSDNAGRTPMLYVGSNGGMLHGINAGTGEEEWAYVPRQVMPNMYKLASTSYGANHQYFVDGSPSVGDVYINTTTGGVGGAGTTWKTIVVGGLNKGGRGYYALDVTDPANPQPLWEICHDATLCPMRSDADMGYSYSEPIITKLPAGNANAGKWVVLVTSGYNNVTPGTGRGYLYVLDAANGQILRKIDTGYGSTTAPTGLGKIANYVEHPDTDDSTLLVYGGDTKGNLFRFNLVDYTVTRMAQLTSPAGTTQPITARPETGKCGDTKLVFVGTGKYLGASDTGDTQRQSIWGLKDSATDLGIVRTSGTLEPRTLQTTATPYQYTVTGNAVDYSTQNGWFLDLDKNEGERVNLDPVLANTNLMVVTNQPVVSDGSAACGTGGQGFLYQLQYCTGKSPDNKSTTVMGQRISTSIVVGFIPIGLPTGVRVKATTADGEKVSPIPVMQPSGSTGGLRRISWSELGSN